MTKFKPPTLKAKRLGIDTHEEPIVYMREDCNICRSEGFRARSQVEIISKHKQILATLNTVSSNLLTPDEAGLSEAAWRLLGARSGENLTFAHPLPVLSLSFVRSKVYGNALNLEQFTEIFQDISRGRYQDIHLAAFVTACTDNRLTVDEITYMTKAMVSIGEQLHWPTQPVVDKHSVGGLPGSCTTPVVVAILAACGLTIPKTSSRAITSPAGTADTMETLAPVSLTLAEMRRVVEKEGGCLVWGNSVNLSPADDVIIGVERALDIDNEGQLIASILSKKAAAGSTHVLIDFPVGDTAKIRSLEVAQHLEALLTTVGTAIGLHTKVMMTDGMQPMGRGIGPVLEAQDILAILQNHKTAPPQLRDKIITFAGTLLEMSSVASESMGMALATETLENGNAWRKFQAICSAQGGMRKLTKAPFTHEITAKHAGRFEQINNRILAKLAKLAGAPGAPSAGLEYHVRLGEMLDKHQPILTLHAETEGELHYALDYFGQHEKELFTLKNPE